MHGMKNPHSFILRPSDEGKESGVGAWHLAVTGRFRASCDAGAEIQLKIA